MQWSAEWPKGKRNIITLPFFFSFTIRDAKLPPSHDTKKYPSTKGRGGLNVWGKKGGDIYWVVIISSDPFICFFPCRKKE